MGDVEGLRARLALPPVSQLGIVVRDVDRAAGYYSSLFGVGPFTIYEFVPKFHVYNGEQTYIRMKLGKAMWGDVEVELIEPMEGSSPHMDFLASRGEGIQHLGFVVPRFDELYDRFVGEGFKPMLRSGGYVEAYKGEVKVCYFDTTEAVGTVFEIMWRSWEPQCRG